MEIFNEFLSNYGSSILYTIITAVLSFIGIKIEKIYENYYNDKITKGVVENTVKYVEQLYHDLNGPEKFKIAKENILKLLKSKSIHINELELDVLIESFCHCLKGETI